MLDELPFQLPPEDEYTFYSLATEFLEAALVLLRTPPTTINYGLVIYYLAGHSAELFLKSFLCKCGEPIEALRKEFGHELDSLAKRAREKGLPARASTAHIEAVSKLYAGKETEYRKNQARSYPALDLLLAEVASLKGHVFDRIDEFTKS